MTKSKIIKPEFSSKPRKVLSGKWNENNFWELHLSYLLPPYELCSAVFCVAKYMDKFMLTKTRRDWEMLGGHIEKNETIEQTLFREALEEGGFKIDRYKLFGYRKITSKKPTIDESRGIQYPFPISYMPHYVAISDSEPQKCFGEECFDNKLFELDEIRRLNIENYSIIEASLNFFGELEEVKKFG